MTKRVKCRFTPEFRAEVVKLVIDGEKTSSQVARDHDLGTGWLAPWVKQVKIDAGGGSAVSLTSAEREELSRARKDLRELRRENDLKKRLPSLRVRACEIAAIAMQVTAFPIQWMCKRLGVSPSGYYAWRSRPESGRKRKDREITVHVRAAFSATRNTYGSPRIYRELKNQGVIVGEKRVWRIMRQNGISCPRKRSFVKTTQSGHGLPVAENLLARDFLAFSPNQKGGHRYHLHHDSRWLYLSRLDHRPFFSAHRGVVNCRQHGNRLDPPCTAASDRGMTPACGTHPPFRSRKPICQSRLSFCLAEHGILCSMSAIGEYWDNAVAESFFGRLKVELIHRYKWESKAHAMGVSRTTFGPFTTPSGVTPILTISVLSTTRWLPPAVRSWPKQTVHKSGRTSVYLRDIWWTRHVR